MSREIQITLLPESASLENEIAVAAAAASGIPVSEITGIRVLKRSVDARQRQVKVLLTVLIFTGDAPSEENTTLPDYGNVGQTEPVIIIGAGPAGLFAALRCIELGRKPIIVERGKDVRARRRDLKALNQNHIVNEDSNYCFGEGGAGTYSDGKLYTRSKKRGDVDRILKLLVGFGANPDILVDAHPHIGTNKLPELIARMRDCILHSGGEVRFNTRVTDILVEAGQVKGVMTKENERIQAQRVILATGHSARDIFELLKQKGLSVEIKPFAIGVRVEHPQELIDRMRYKCEVRGPYLPPAPYSVVRQVEGRGVYSFCMCPGGIIAPCATAPGEVVTNGWSPSKRDQPYANSGIVVELKPQDFSAYSSHGALAGVALQRQIEHRCWVEAGKTQRVPAQRLTDFVSGRPSESVPKSSYVPGTVSVEMKSVLPDFIAHALREGFREFARAMPGYLTNEAILHAPESRTSSPVRIPRDPKTLEHVEARGLYPCGEGAGYAGGIISAAIDGEKCAEMACA